MTISFLGNILLDNIPQLTQSIDEVLNLDHFKVSIEKTGVFPSIQLPKILWLGVGNDLQKLNKLHVQVEKAVNLFKLRAEKENFIPHFTIGRVPQSYGKIDVLPFLEYVYSPRELAINSLALYESQLLPTGINYKVITQFPLN